jgi:exodeoxyribonuclease VII small subunit
MTKPVDYVALSSELDTIVAKLQSSDLDVEEAVKAYTRGMEITQQLEKYLKQAENQVIKIKADWEGGAKKI